MDRYVVVSIRPRKRKAQSILHLEDVQDFADRRENASDFALDADQKRFPAAPGKVSPGLLTWQRMAMFVNLPGTISPS